MTLRQIRPPVRSYCCKGLCLKMVYTLPSGNNYWLPLVGYALPIVIFTYLAYIGKIQPIYIYIHIYIHTYLTLPYPTLHYTTLHYITLHYITYIHTYDDDGDGDGDDDDERWSIWDCVSVCPTCRVASNFALLRKLKRLDHIDGVKRGWDVCPNTVDLHYIYWDLVMNQPHAVSNGISMYLHPTL